MHALRGGADGVVEMIFDAAVFEKRDEAVLFPNT